MPPRRYSSRCNDPFTILRAVGRFWMRFLMGKLLKKTAAETGRIDEPKVPLYRLFCTISHHLCTVKWGNLQHTGC